MHSTLFHIGPVPIRAYGLMLWIGLVVGLIRSVRAAKKYDIKPDYVVDTMIYSLVAGIIFAHITSILLDLPFYWHNPHEIVTLWKGAFSAGGGIRGLSFHGGLIGGLLAAFIYTRKKGVNFLSMADLLSPALSLTYGITRIGCFLNGCCYGIPTKLPWGVRFCEDGQWTQPSHPTQLYATGISLVIFFILVGIENRRRFIGQVFASYIVLYSIYRFLIEFLRKGVTADVIFAGITEAQLVSLIMLAIAVPILWINLRKSQSASNVKDSPSAVKPGKK